MDDKESKAIDELGSLTWEHRNSGDLGHILWDAGYRKDPYPNGKTKDQLIEIIEGLKDTNAQLTIKIAALETALKGVKP